MVMGSKKENTLQKKETRKVHVKNKKRKHTLRTCTRTSTNKIALQKVKVHKKNTNLQHYTL